MDTGILVDYLRYLRSSRPKNKRQAFLSQQAVKLIEGFIQKEVPIFISVHTLKELLQYPYISPEEEKRILEDIPIFCKIIGTGPKVAKIAGLLSRQSAEYREHHVEDCYIAATAIARGLPLYTTNPKDFEYVKHNKLKIFQPYAYIEKHSPGDEAKN
ncbi:MAG: PIN domain-containing protein [Moorella sp. (in: firmicutes)]